MAVINGTDVGETLVGGSEADQIHGLGGDDVLVGGAGADVLDGGNGLDYASYSTATLGVTASLANPASNTGDAAGDTYISIERLEGSSYNDILTGDDNDNTLRGGAGKDKLDGGAGFDFASYYTAAAGLTVSLANPSINTGDADGDTFVSIEGLSGSTFNDTLIGDAGANWLIGQGGADVLDGGAGFDYAAYANATSGVRASLASPGTNTGEAAGDTYISIEGLIGSEYDDVLIGDDGNNWLVGRGGADVLDGGAGFDYAGYFNATSGVTASLAAPGTNTGEAAGDTYIGIEALAGSRYDDKLVGDGTGNWLRGGAGGDILDGQGGEDTASYWDAGTAVVASLAAPSTNTGDAAGDTYISIERLAGSQYADTLTGDANNNWLVGEAGADALDGGDGNDTAAYHNSGSGLTASLATPSVNTGEAAGDTYISIENLYGTRFADRLTGDAGANWLGGNDGDDVLVGGAGADVLDGGNGLDYASYSTATLGVTASLANPASNTGDAAGDTYISIERLEGSSYNDILTGDDNDNTLRGGAGKDKLDGGAGFDFASYYTAAAGLTVSLANPSINTGDADGDTFVSIEGLSGSTFNDTLIGDAGANWLIGQGGADVLDGGAGFDYAAYANATSGVRASLASPGTNTGEAAGDTYISIEGLIGSEYDDVLIGDDGNNWLVGRGGADVLDGGAGFDYAGYFNATSGVTASLAAPGTNTGEAAGDTYIGIEALAGSRYDDKLVGDGTGNWLRGGAGGDILDGQGGEDTASYWDAGTAVVASLAAPSTNTGDAAGDTYISIERLAGSQYADTLTGDANNNWLVGEAGADALDGGDGNDTAAYHNSGSGLTASLATPSVNTGEAAGDTYISIENLYGTRFADRLTGDAGANWLGGNDGDDVLVGGAGNDELDGGSGTDIAIFTAASAQVLLTRTGAGVWTAVGPDGSDTLRNIEIVRFSDGDVELPSAAPPRDYNGDGRSDVLFRNLDGSVAQWQMNGTTIASDAVLPSNPGTGWKTAGIGDFNGDGKADVLYRNDDGRVAQWQMNGNTIVNNVVLGSNPGMSWKVSGVGDFDGDGKADVLFRNDDGRVAQWRMNGTTVVSDAVLPNNPGTSWKVAGVGDFNGDGKSDVLWRHDDGRVAEWQMNGTSIVSDAVLSSNPGTGWKVAGIGDFNGDGKSDVLWRHDDGRVAEWQMNGSSILSDAVLGNPGTAWKVGDVGDYNGDGKADILWRNDDGRIAEWQMNGNTIVNNVVLASNPGTSWQPFNGSLPSPVVQVSAARGDLDLNGDGKADVLFRNDDGRVAEWQMNGNTIVSSVVLSSNPGTAWKVAGTGDFNGDGRSDILWQHDDGRVAEWQMNGNTIVNNVVLGSNPGTGWKVAGVGDFNGDGKSDVLWRHDDGRVAQWQMNGTSIVSDALINSTPNTSWKVAGVGDFNGDGKADILWRNSTTGQVAEWQMNGNTIVNNVVLGSNPGTSWNVAGVGDFNGDGRSDVLWGHVDGRVAEWQMNGTAITSDAVLGNPGTVWQVADIGDYNGDGRSDILWHNSSTGAAAEWQMNGNTIVNNVVLSESPSLDWHLV